MDALSQTLRVVRLVGAIFIKAKFTAPWSYQSPQAATAAPLLEPGAERVVIFHLITEGECYVELADEPPVHLRGGDVVVFPQGDAHVMSSAPNIPPGRGARLEQVLARRPRQLVYGGGGETTRLVCGYLACDLRLAKMLFAGLPSLLKVNVRGSSAGAWLEASLRYALAEARSPRPGGEGSLPRRLGYARVEDRRGLSHLCAARSVNGVDDWQIDGEPTLLPDAERYPEEIWGIEDPRITYLPELKKYAVAYTSYSRGGPGVSLALTDDFRSFERLGVVMSPDDKDAALLPRRIGGFWALIHRPMTTLGSHMWISYSPDLRHWGRHRLMLEARRGAWWDANKIGMSPPPIETARGWLVLYHGVRHTPSGCLYRLGVALFELENPEKCVLRGDSWIFGPEAEYERHGDVDDVVFPCGYTLDADGDTLNIYYGAADCAIALARASVHSLLDWLDANASYERRQRVQD